MAVQDERQMREDNRQRETKESRAADTGMPEGGEPSQTQDEQEQFAFLQEKIKTKDEPGKKKFPFLRTATLGLVFGIFACCSFCVLKPLMENMLQGDRGEVNIPEDEEEPENKEDADGTEESVVFTFDAGSYAQMMQSMYAIAREAEKSVVSVQITNQSSWMQADGHNVESVTGVIAVDNGWEVLIVADNAVCVQMPEDGQRQWSVTFADGSSYPATLKKQDKNHGLAVFAVSRMAVSDNTWNNVRTVIWGNSNAVSKGDVVIALGNMFGYDGGLGYGVISSKKYDELYADGTYGVLATDIAAEPDGSGVLVNQRGEVLGFIRGSIWQETSSNTAKALAISDLKPVMEKLLNGESVPYIGIKGITVTENLANQQGIPQGLYVTEVMEDSPAAYAGIQKGDVIQKVHGTEALGITSYEKSLFKCDAGDQVKVKGKRRGTLGYVDVEYIVTVGSLE